jgi:hypothetical protein
MSIEVLYSADSSQIKQKAAHDLESIFYVLLYICSKLNGPDGPMRMLGEPEKIGLPIDQWFCLYPTFRDLGEKKFAQLMEIQSQFIDKFTHYFHDLRSCMMKLFDTLFPTVSVGFDSELRHLKTCCGTHDAMIRILQDTYDQLPDEVIPKSRRSKRKADQLLTEEVTPGASSLRRSQRKNNSVNPRLADPGFSSMATADAVDRLRPAKRIRTAGSWEQNMRNPENSPPNTAYSGLTTTRITRSQT